MSGKRFCYFCGLREDVLDYLVTRDDIGICDRCVKMCAIVINEAIAAKQKGTDSPNAAQERKEGK